MQRWQSAKELSIRCLEGQFKCLTLMLASRQMDEHLFGVGVCLSDLALDYLHFKSPSGYFERKATRLTDLLLLFDYFTHLSHFSCRYFIARQVGSNSAVAKVLWESMANAISVSQIY